MTSLSNELIHSIVNASCSDVFAYLGPHKMEGGEYVVRCFLPSATDVTITESENGAPIAKMQCIHEAGLFEALVDAPLPPYRLNTQYQDGVYIAEDPYRFSSSISEKDLYWIGEGTHEHAYRVLGAHLMSLDGVFGCRFAVWAPNALCVSVVGDFNFWDGRKHVMRKLIPSGIWEIFIPGVDEGLPYQYELKAADGRLLPRKSDPFGFLSQETPAQASVVFNTQKYQWGDESWQHLRAEKTGCESAISIYEVHIGSWRRVPEEGNRYQSYRELTDSLIPYIKEMGFTHVQLLPVSEHPFDGSWGYQPIGMYAPTSRFGTPDDFKYFVDCCHQNELAVLIDWVPGHFPTDTHGLGLFDGSPLYEHSDFRQGFHPDWNTYIYNYGRKEVANYLMANAMFWLDEYHIDGLRVDAVASMLYLDYSRKEGEWLPNAFGGRENLEAIDFLRLTNERVYKNHPNVMMIAEESTSWPGVSKPTNYGGLGFGYKWNMGWMNDSLDYMSKNPVHRQFHHNDMTFSLYYAFSENFILPLSHDEVVHGKGSLLHKMPGDTWQKFANLRAYYGFMWGHPGKKMLFMGCEFAQGPEWDHDSSLSWHQLQIAEHSGVQALVKDLNGLYTTCPALFKYDTEEAGFEWIEADDSHHSVFSFIRKNTDDSSFVIVVSNFTPVPRERYRVGVNEPGKYVEILNTDNTLYSGSGKLNSNVMEAQEQPWQYRHYSIEVDIPPLATIFIVLDKT